MSVSGASSAQYMRGLPLGLWDTVSFAQHSHGNGWLTSVQSRDPNQPSQVRLDKSRSLVGKRSSCRQREML